MPQGWTPVNETPRQKGQGYFGPLKRPDGSVSTEISIGVNIDGREMEIPTLVPTLSEREKQWLITNDISDPRTIPQSIVDKADAHARQRIAQGLSPFADDGAAGGWTPIRDERGEAFDRAYWSNRSIGESGQPDPVVATGRLDAFLRDRLNPALEGPARPSSLTDLVGLAIPSAGGLNVRVPLVNMLRETLGAAKQSANWRNVPGDVLDRLLTWAKTPASDIGAQRTAMAPRLAGKAPSLTDALTDALQSVRDTPVDAVSLPGGNTMRIGPRYQDYRVAGEAPRPAGRTYSSEPTPRPSSPAGTSSGAPPAAAGRESARSTPPPPAAFRLTPEESQALQQMVQEGYEEATVLRAIAEQRAVRPTHAPATSKSALNPAEAKEFRRLTGRGMDPKAAMDLIERQRALVQTKGLPTTEQAQRAVTERNQTGRWD